MLEAWKFRWTNAPNPPQSGFHHANKIPLSLQPTERFRKTDRKTFSRLVQCRTGHAHTGEYYRKFVPMESTECPCGTNLQTREHIVKSCRLFYRHRHILGTGQHAQMGRLMGTIKGIRKLITFIKRSGAFDKPPTPKDRTQEEEERERREEEEWSTYLREMLQ